MTNGIVAEYAAIMLKGFGVAILTHICSLTCRECGKGALADSVELAGKLEIFLLCIPLMQNVIETAKALLEL